MADSKEMKTSLDDSNAEPDITPDAASNATEALSPSNEERSLDVGESGQFAPGGRYNQLGVNSPRRIDLDEQVDSALGEDNKS